MTEEKKWPSAESAMDESDDGVSPAVSLAPHAKEHLAVLKSAGLSKLHDAAVEFLRARVASAKAGSVVAPGVVWSGNSSEIPVLSIGNGSGRVRALVRPSLPASSPPTTTTFKAKGASTL